MYENHYDPMVGEESWKKDPWALLLALILTYCAILFKSPGMIVPYFSQV